MLVKDLMKKPYIIEKDASLEQVARIMSSKGIGYLIFVSKGKIKGILTERDLLKHFGKGGKSSRIMTKSVITISPEEDIQAALKVMKENKIKRLPVIENKELIGIVTLTDIAANAAEIGEDFFFN